MGLSALLGGAGREWRAQSEACASQITRAGSLQARQQNMPDLVVTARQLVKLYAVDRKPLAWQEYGDVALHVVASWPADLAYMVIYALRELKDEIGYDPVPPTLKAVEMLHALRPSAVQLHLAAGVRADDLVASADDRGRRAACIIAREISGVPLRYASAIYHSLDARAKGFVDDALRQFNPSGAKILQRAPRGWPPTLRGIFLGVLRRVLRILFGRD